jgi:hypothetical protein
LIVDVVAKQNASIPLPMEHAELSNKPASGIMSPPPMPSESLLKSLLRVVSSVFEPTDADVAESEDSNERPIIYSWPANTATGRGAFPLPSIIDTPVAGCPTYNSKDPVSDFPWNTVFLADQACDGPLPDAASRDHQVIVMRRGGCSFSEKLDNIPNFPVKRTALQLVIVLDEPPTEDEDEGEREETPRPLLDTEQLTPKGMKRLHGVPMVLMRAASGDYDLFRNASGVGMRRKYRVRSQGLLVENAIVI